MSVVLVPGASLCITLRVRQWVQLVLAAMAHGGDVCVALIKLNFPKSNTHSWQLLWVGFVSSWI